MTGFEELASDKQKREPYVCASCGNCTMVCPVFREMKWEQYGPRGKLNVMKSIFEGKADFDFDFARKIFLCSLCEHCSTVCPTSIHLDRFWELARAEAWKSGLVPASVSSVRESMIKRGDPFAMGSGYRMMWAEDIEDQVEPHIQATESVVYFVGCNASLKHQLQGIPQSMIKIMQHAKVDFTLLGTDETCCGAPLIWSGDFENAPQLAQKNIDQMRDLGVKTIVFSCPTCIHIWKNVYKEILGISVAEEFGLLTTSQFIQRLIDEERLNFEEQPMITVTFHDPCVSARQLDVIREPRDIIERIPGVYKVEMVASEKDTKCCGNHALLNVVDPLMASQIAEKRLRDVSVTPASMLVSECPRCKLAFTLASEMMQYSVGILDISELVANSLKEGKS